MKRDHGAERSSSLGNKVEPHGRSPTWSVARVCKAAARVERPEVAEGGTGSERRDGCVNVIPINHDMLLDLLDQVWRGRRARARPTPGRRTRLCFVSLSVTIIFAT